MRKRSSSPPPDACAGPASRRRRAGSLRLTLILPYVALIALLTGSLALLWYWTSSKTVSTLSAQVMREMAERIGQAVDRHIYGSGAVLEAAFPVGMPAPADIEQDLPGLYTRFWTATSLHPEPNDYVYYGNVVGQGVGVKRRSRDEVEIRIKTDAEDHRRYYRLAGIGATPVYESTEMGLFDPRERPWYQLARDAASHTWTSVYIDFNLQDLVVTRARRVLAPDGAFAGVVGTDVFLHALHAFVAQLPLSPQGRAFIIQPGGELIAASGLPNVRRTADGSMERVTADNSGDPLIRAVYDAIQPVFAQPVQARQTGSVLLEDASGANIQVAFRRVTDSAGLDWMAVVAVPDQEMLAGLNRHMVLVAALGLLALGLAVALGLRIFGRVANDMHTLAHAVRRVGAGEIDTPLHLARRDEIGELADNFHAMRQSLFTDPLTGVANRGALQHLLATLTRPRDDGAPLAPFAVLFIDLNRFKPLNDQWGHDNGDLALTEVARRLRALLPSTDLVARLGGDEFVLVLRGMADRAQLRQVMAQVEVAVRAPLTTLQGVPPELEVYVTAAVGMACFPADALDAQSLLKQADQDMYRAKGERSR